MTPDDAKKALRNENVTQALQVLEQIYAKHDITDSEKNDIDIILSAFHHFQMLNKKGRFFDQVGYLMRN